MKKRILIVDDDEKIGEKLAEYLQGYNFDVCYQSDSKKAIESFKLFQADIILLDIMMPEINGLEICKQIREISKVPLIFLSARSEVSDKVLGLELGADDYLPKPFEPRELVARIESVLRRFTDHTDEQIIEFKSLKIDCYKREVLLGNVSVDLTTMEYELLLMFAQNSGKKFTRDDIMNHLKGIDDNVYSRSVDILVSRLRQKLNDDKKQLIETIWGTGYLFNGQK